MIHHSSILTSASLDEFHVAQILLHISTTIRTLQYSGSALKWGSKKKRSRSASALHPPPPHTASHVTPLAFSLHYKSKLKTTSNKKLRKKYIQMIEELSQRRDLLQRELENVTNSHNKLVVYNSQLKAMKQVAIKCCRIKEEHQLENRNSIRRNLATELIPKNHQMILEAETHSQPLVHDQMAEEVFPTYNGPISAYLCNGPRSNNRVGPAGIPDLNVTAEGWDPCQPLDNIDGRSRSAEARRRRMDIIRAKCMRRTR